MNATADPAQGWRRSLAGAVLGSATGVSALLLYTNGLFVAGLTQDYGLTRVQFGFGVLLVTMALAGANPVVGWLVDRFGAKWLSVAGLLLLSVGFGLAGPVHRIGEQLFPAAGDGGAGGRRLGANRLQQGHQRNIQPAPWHRAGNHDDRHRRRRGLHSSPRSPMSSPTSAGVPAITR
ncbi:MAG: MFS transporter [Proteobacteria bacterium]|nr:MFS transporter [Pseudomonadota bacterium]